MTALLSLLAVIVISTLIVRVATVALTMTGISAPLARFQARSAFTGAGFTTSESEKVVSHPVRRRIIMLLMLLGNAGIVTAVSSLMLSFVGSENRVVLQRLVALMIGLLVIWLAVQSKWVEQGLDRLIRHLLTRYTKLQLKDYYGLLHLSGGYIIAELMVEADDWLADRRLVELRLMDEGVIVLGIEKPNGVYHGSPRGDRMLHSGDNLIIYGQADTIENLDSRDRSEGNWDHFRAVSDRARRDREEDRSTPAEPTSAATEPAER